MFEIHVTIWSGLKVVRIFFGGNGGAVKPLGVQHFLKHFMTKTVFAAFRAEICIKVILSGYILNGMGFAKPFSSDANFRYFYILLSKKNTFNVLPSHNYWDVCSPEHF